MTKETTKVCPECGNDKLALFRDTNEKACINHVPVFYFPWYLDEGQKSLDEGARAKRKASDE